MTATLETPAAVESVEDFRQRARAWLSAHASERGTSAEPSWGVGRFDVSVFHDLTEDEERSHLDAIVRWHQTKCDAGFGALSWPVEQGGAGLSPAHVEAFHEEELRFDVPGGHELFDVTLALIAPTVAMFGTPEQQARFLPAFLRADELACQLFSEPGAGSDLAALSTRAVRDGDDWVVTGQKVWTSGAQFAGWGELIARTDATAAKHAGLTAFLLPLDSPGVTVRPLRQMSGGSSFNEVFLDEVRIPDSLRLGPEGAGWKVTLATLGFERGGGGAPRKIGGGYRELLDLARWLGRDTDPIVRQRLAEVYAHERVGELSAARADAERRPGQPPGPEGSVKKLHWVAGMSMVSEVAALLLGPRLAADTGEWGTYDWTAHLLGAPGYRIAGGSDEIQRNILAERVLGMPAEPRPGR
ncbi:MAG: acyl-CoA dehydrogenase family protein [Mycobacteriales bacterium]